MRRKIAFGIFHLDDSNNLLRNSNTAEIKTSMAGTWFDLKVKTVKIDSVAELSYYSSIEKLNFSKFGYEYEGTRGWKLGELSIWIGNVLAWKKFLNSDFSYLILFEDDVKLEKNFADIVHQTFLATPKDWDVISLFTPETESSKCKVANDLQNNLVPVFQDYSCLSYAVSKKGAKNLLESLVREGEINQPIDWYLWRNIPKLNILSLHPESLKPFSLLFIESTFQQKQVRSPIT
jgi:hypothetical protein